MENLPEPPLKRTKKEEKSNSKDDVSESLTINDKMASLSNPIIDKYIEKIKRCLNVKAVLADDIEKPVPLIKVTIGHLINQKEISKTISLLNEKLPLKELSHLKRARIKDILLCPTSILNGASIQSFIDKNLPELKFSFDFFKEIDVPALAPKVKKQFGNLQTWSLNFHPNKYLESLAGDNFFSRDQMRFHNACMSMAFTVAQWHLQNDISVEKLKEVNATIVVDPTIHSVVAVSFCNKDHPVQHSTMLAIDNVAKTQNGGAWGESTIESFNCTLSGMDHALQIHLKQEYRQISFGARVFKSKRVGNTSDSEKSDVEDVLESPYLCTGYNVYCLKEPCIMCCMALVHARAKRIFFCFDNAAFGGLKSKVKLQAVPSLNHHFEVFTGFLEKEDI